MYICQWSLEIVFGKQKQALEIMKEWGAEKFRSSRFKKSFNRVYVGHIGESPSLIIDEYEFEQLEDFTVALSEMGQPQFKPFADAIAPLIVPGTQKWKVFRKVS
jgi:predicted component of type VI protein secretion system